MALPVEVLIGVGTVAVAVVGAAAYSHFSGNSASVDIDDDGTDELTFEGEKNERIETEPSPYPSDDDTQQTGGLAETSSTDKENDAATPTDVQETGEDLESITGIGPVRAETFNENGFETAADLYYASDENILSVDGIGERALGQIRDDIGGIDHEPEGESEENSVGETDTESSGSDSDDAEDDAE